MKRFLLGGVLAAMLFVTLGATLTYWFLWPDSPRNREHTIRVVLEWGRLAPFPKSATKLSIQTTGSMFTRGFRVRFQAPAKEIENWLKASPGTSNVAPELIDLTRRSYSIQPGGGAQHAEVNVDDETHTVNIYVYWS